MLQAPQVTGCSRTKFLDWRPLHHASLRLVAADTNRISQCISSNELHTNTSILQTQAQQATRTAPVAHASHARRTRYLLGEKSSPFPLLSIVVLINDQGSNTLSPSLVSKAPRSTSERLSRLRVGSLTFSVVQQPTWPRP